MNMSPECTLNFDQRPFFENYKPTKSLVIAYFQNYQESLLLANFCWIHSHSKEVSYVS